MANTEEYSQPLALLITTGIVLATLLLALRTRRPPKPPGPRRLPLLGNIGNGFPPKGIPEREHWLSHKRLYGPISSVSAGGQTVVIVHDIKVAQDLLEKRSSNYSGRPKQTFHQEVVGWGDFLGTLPYNENFRTQRKLAHGLFGSQVAMQRFQPLQEKETSRLCLRLLNEPEGFLEHARKLSGAIVLKLTYGYTIEPHTPDHFVDLADKIADEFMYAASPGRFIVDYFPFLSKLPEWIPGSPHRLARDLIAGRKEFVYRPLAFTRQQMAKEDFDPCFVSLVYEMDNPLTSVQRAMLIGMAPTIYLGGADTTSGTVQAFFLMMMLHPAAQIKAQEEIDRVIGSERIPVFADRRDLPYVEALFKEVLRWHPVGPMGVPHGASEDDVYDGYLIPRGAMIMPNIWAMCHDETRYPDPGSFRPERFLGESAQDDPRRHTFGFGRRVCPGQLLAGDTVWLSIAKTLAVFSFRPPIDADGKELEQEIKWTNGFVSRPEPFKLRIEPRSARHAQLVADLESTFPWEKGSALPGWDGECRL